MNAAKVGIISETKKKMAGNFRKWIIICIFAV
jgi:hypothetical protein